jgi:PP-loop family
VKCRKCGGQASIELRRHNAAFCADDFVDFFRNQVREAIRKFRMFGPDETVLVAVSGGKDSLALWDTLITEGYSTTGLYLDLGIFDYSVESRAKCEAFAAARGVPLIVSKVADEVGAPVPVIKQVTRRPPCSGCGLSKRYLMNRVALEHGFPVVATGHNLDDEAATLFGSVMHWQTDALPRQSPALASTHPKLVRRVKPLYRLPPADRLHRGGMPVRGGRHLDRPQGNLDPHGGSLPGRQAQLPVRVPRQGARGVRAGRGGDAERVCALRPGDDRNRLRVLQAGRPGQTGEHRGAPRLRRRALKERGLGGS